jgi:nitroreductase
MDIAAAMKGAPMNSPKQAKLDHPINDLIAERWSPCAFAARPVSKQDLCSLFEAARWAPSSYNEQPWSYIVATRDDGAAYEQLLSCLVEGNQGWAKTAPVLALGCTTLTFSRNNQPNDAAQHDLGLASAMLCLEAAARGLFVHQMIGILPDRARDIYKIPPAVRPLTGLAIGYLGDPNQLPEHFRQRDLAPRSRKPLGQFVYGGTWGSAAQQTAT